MRLLVSLGFVFLASTGWGQTSTGFQDPSQVSPLLDYRLPTWGYKLWDASFQLNGGGHDFSHAGRQGINNSFNTSLNSDFIHYRESEQCIRTLRAGLGGRYQRNHSANEDSEISGHRLNMDYDLSARAQRYLGDLPLAVILGLGDSRSYDEDIRTSRYGSDSQEIKHFQRRSQHDFELGAGWGRLRDVVPLIRAQRLSERLATMGHRRLSVTETQQVAEVIAQEYGYGRVYDRKSRHFWEEVLEPLLEEKLTPYEVFYLVDVMNENVGPRQQGAEVMATWVYQGDIRFSSHSPEDSKNRGRTALVVARWSHNLSLEHQLRLGLSWNYTLRNTNNQQGEWGSLDGLIEHLWNVADRHIWTNSLQFGGDSSIHDQTREKSANLNSRWDMFLEDQLSLRTILSTRYYWRRNPSGDIPGDEEITHGWNWGYSVSLVYHIDRILF